MMFLVSESQPQAKKSNGRINCWHVNGKNSLHFKDSDSDSDSLVT